MFDVIIYYKNGKRSMYDHVSQITNINNENIVIDFITDFNDQLTKIVNASEVDSINVRCMK